MLGEMSSELGSAVVYVSYVYGMQAYLPAKVKTALAARIIEKEFRAGGKNCPSTNADGQCAKSLEQI